MCVDTFSALIQHFLYAILFGGYYIVRSAKKDLYKQALFCGKLKYLAVGQKVVNKIAEKLRGKLSLWHCNYLPIREKGIGKIKICNFMMTFFHYPPQTIISHKSPTGSCAVRKSLVFSPITSAAAPDYPTKHPCLLHMALKPVAIGQKVIHNVF